MIVEALKWKAGSRGVKRGIATIWLNSFAILFVRRGTSLETQFCRGAILGRCETNGGKRWEGWIEDGNHVAFRRLESFERRLCVAADGC